MKRIHAALLLALPLILVPSILAQAPIDSDEVPLYTNADIEKLEPLPTGRSVTPARYDTSAHAFVAEFIRREREKITADRDYELERERVENEAARPIGHGEQYPWFLRTPYYDTSPTPAPIRTRPPLPEPASKPHPMFDARPPVREFVPGLGGSYRGDVPSAPAETPTHRL